MKPALERETERDTPLLGEEGCTASSETLLRRQVQTRSWELNRKHLLTTSSEFYIVGYELNVILHFHAGMSGFLKYGVTLTSRMHLGTDVGCGCVDRAVGEAHDNIHMAQDTC